MLRRLWWWLWGPPLIPPGPRFEHILDRIEGLEDRYNRLTRRFDRMQGEFNAITRAELDDEEDEFAPIPE